VLSKCTPESGKLLGNHLSETFECGYTLLLCPSRKNNNKRNGSQMKHQLDATLCRFYFCRVTLHVSGASAHHHEYLKLVQRPLVHVISLQVSHHISLLGPIPVHVSSTMCSSSRCRSCQMKTPT